MIRVCVLGSGSKGNAVYAEIDGKGLLLDAGLPCRTLAARLGGINRDLSCIGSVLISHQHGDHVQGLPRVMKKHPVMVVLSEDAGTICPGEKLDVSGIKVVPFRLSHDDPCCGFTVSDRDGNKLAYVPDTGCIPEDALLHLFDCSVIIMEFNHDVDLLTSGPYPSELQERISSDSGHMRNEESREILKMIAWSGLEYVVCFHLSEKNNSEKLAMYEATSGVMEKAQNCKVIVAKQSESTDFITVM
jgi:phosphoribosyl 1,2-cyclic phosphodiesterase